MPRTGGRACPKAMHQTASTRRVRFRGPAELSDHRPPERIPELSILVGQRSTDGCSSLTHCRGTIGSQTDALIVLLKTSPHPSGQPRPMCRKRSGEQRADSRSPENLPRRTVQVSAGVLSLSRRASTMAAKAGSLYWSSFRSERSASLSRTSSSRIFVPTASTDLAVLVSTTTPTPSASTTPR